ncbi:MAG TPA: metal-sensing transcriptional repressor [Anaerolineales bacterium]
MTDNRKRILWRLRTVQGHLRAIGDLFEAGETCEEILIQLKAVRGAIDAIAAQLFYDQVERSKQVICEEPSLNRRSEELERLVKLYSAWKQSSFINYNTVSKGACSRAAAFPTKLQFFEDI